MSEPKEVAVGARTSSYSVVDLGNPRAPRKSRGDTIVVDAPRTFSTSPAADRPAFGGGAREAAKPVA